MWIPLNIIQFIAIVLWFLLPGFVAVFLLPRKLMYRFIRGAWCKWGLFIVGIKMRTKGQLPSRDRSFMFLANHASYADILLLNVALERPLHYIAKKELSKIPILNMVMKKTECIMVSRGFNKESRKAYTEAVAHIKKGLDIVVFPEGTRTKTGNLQKLRKGSFQMAVDAGVPIVPIAIKNAGKCWPRNNFSFRFGVVDVIFGEPIETDSYTRETIPQLMVLFETRLRKLAEVY